MIKGAIFDADGTLLDSMGIWDTVGEDCLKEWGYSPREDFSNTVKSMSLNQSAQYVIDEYGVKLSKDEIIERVCAAVDDFYRYEVELKQGMRELLETLYRRGVRMCVATAGSGGLVRAALTRLGIERYFIEILDCEAYGTGKDEPKIYREALKLLGTDKTSTIVFEDTLYALKTAKADGFLTAAVYDIREENQAEVKTLADYYLSDSADIISFQRLVSAF